MDVQKGLPFHSKVSASEGAIEGLTRALAAEFAPSIRVSCIAPSLTDTPLAAGLKRATDKYTQPLIQHWGFANDSFEFQELWGENPPKLQNEKVNVG